MYRLNCVCFICLSDTNLNTVFQKIQEENEIFTKVKYALPELTSLDPDITLRICSSCDKILHSFYIFKKMCLENYNHLIRNTKKIYGTSDNQKFNALQVKIINSEPIIKREFIEVNEDESVSVEDEEERNITEDPIAVKEELGSSEDSAGPYFYQQIVKSESISYNVQDFGSNATSEDENQLNNFEINSSTHTDNVKSTCNKNVSDKLDLSQNMKVYTTDNELKCYICNKEYLVPYDFNQHLKMHANIKDFQCSICNKQFSRSYGLKVHMNIHAGIRKVIECSVCNKQLSGNYNLKQHMKLHAGIKDFGCSICYKQFSRNDTLKQHMKLHEGNRDVECLICYKKFTKHGYLKQHMKIHEHR